VYVCVCMYRAKTSSIPHEIFPKPLCTHMHTHEHSHTHTHAHTNQHTHTHKHTQTQTQTHRHTHTSTNTRTHTKTHMHTRTHTHTHTQIQTQTQSNMRKQTSWFSTHEETSGDATQCHFTHGQESSEPRNTRWKLFSFDTVFSRRNLLSFYTLSCRITFSKLKRHIFAQKSLIVHFVL